METVPYKRKIHFYETDQMAIVHHSNYIRWFEEARIDFMEQLGYGYEKMSKTGVDIAVIGIACRYKAMCHFGETVIIKLGITKFTHSRMSISYEVTNAATGMLCAEGESNHCCVDTARQRPVSLKKAAPKIHELFSMICASGNNNL